MLGRLILWGLSCTITAKGKLETTVSPMRLCSKSEKLFIKRASAKTTGAFLFLAQVTAPIMEK